MKECSIFYLTRSIQTGKDSSSCSICIWCNHIFPALVSSFFKFLSQSLCQRCGIVHQGTPFTIGDLLLMKHGFACKSMSFFFPVYPGEEVLTHVKVTGIRHSIMTCHVTCSALQRNTVNHEPILRHWCTLNTLGIVRSIFNCLIHYLLLCHRRQN